jgi:flagellar biosynthesis/type III secretory pathway protein FliH
VSQAAFDRGYQEGLRGGQNDRYNNRGYDYQNDNAYRDATAGYNNQYGDRNSYRNSFRQGYQRGYDEGYNNQNSGRSGSRGRDILGTIFGRP